jgi:hypothetical protein
MKSGLVESGLLALALFAAVTAHSSAALAQTVEVPGGATGSNVACLQAGELSSGAYVGTFLQTAPGTWEERLKAGTFKMQEKDRNDLAVNLVDDTRAAAIEFDFVNKTIKYKPASSKEKSGRDRYYILNATDKTHSEDCAALAQSAAAAPGSPGGGARPPSGPGNTPIVMMQVPPRMQLDIPPGTQFTAIGGPPCPGSPGFFLCPNRFSCAPIGGVCCPGVGGCAAGLFCDHFIPNNCIGPGNPRFCAPEGTPGIATHCDVGMTCLGGNNCQ